MKILDKPIGSLVEQDLADLVGVEESRRLEFKRDLPGGTDKARREFLADVTAFANSAGGAIVFGIEAPGGVASRIVGLDDDADSARLRMQQMLDSSVEPRIPLVELQTVPLQSGRSVIVLRVRRSWVAPHMVTFKGSQQFFARRANGKMPLDVHEIRAAFVGSEQLRDRVRAFRVGRLAAIAGGETPCPLDIGSGVLVVHVVPASLGVAAIDLSPFTLGNTPKPSPLYRASRDWRPNLDGFVVWSGEPPVSYVQLFRDGAIEATWAGPVYVQPPEEGGRRILQAQGIEEVLIESVRGYIGQLADWSADLPVFVSVSILGVKGCCVQTQRFYGEVGLHRIDRDDVLVPTVLTETFDVEIDALLRPVLDTIWQAAGQPGSPNFRDGKYVVR